jgi:hypothetical protein
MDNVVCEEKVGQSIGQLCKYCKTKRFPLAVLESCPLRISEPDCVKCPCRFRRKFKYEGGFVLVVGCRFPYLAPGVPIESAEELKRALYKRWGKRKVGRPLGSRKVVASEQPAQEARHANGGTGVACPVMPCPVQQ